MNAKRRWVENAKDRLVFFTEIIFDNAPIVQIGTNLLDHARCVFDSVAIA